MTKKVKKYIPKTAEEVLHELKKSAKFPELLKVKKKDKAPKADEILISKFEEVTKFVEENGLEPSDKGNGPIEFTLFSRLLDIRSNPQKVQQLLPFDRCGLLAGYGGIPKEEEEEEVQIQESEPKKNESKSKLGLSDRFNLLQSKGNSIFELKNVKSFQEKVTTMPKEVAKRKKCKDFDKFEPIFKKCQEEIENGDRQVVVFRNEHDVSEGAFFIYNGITCYVAEIGKVEIKNNRKNARLRLIFENGFESNMYKRSLTAELYKGGRRILPPRISEGQQELSEEETTGFIYILRSKSEKPEIKAIPDLYKIGFSTTSVEQRIKNALNESTYLMDAVSIIATYRVGGIKPVYFENLIRRLFGHVQVEIEVIDDKGNKKKPKEWFSVPYDVIDDAISLLQTGEIVDYVYDASLKRLIKP